MPALVCDCADRTPVDVGSGLSAAFRVADGTANASAVGEVGDGAFVSSELLDYAGIDIEESAWHGWFRVWEVVAAYPVSQWVPPEGEEEGHWQRVRTATKTWTREHTGGTVIPTGDPKTYVDDYAEEGLDLDEDEMIIPGHTDDPEDFGADYIDRTQSTITASDEVDGEALVAWVQANLSEDWGTFADVDPGDFGALGLGICGGVLFDGGYGEDDRPWRAVHLAGRWAGAAIYADDPPIGFAGFGSPWMAEPGLAFRFFVDKGYADYRGDPPSFGLIGTHEATLTYREDQGHWSSSPDLADPDSIGWADFTTSEPGKIIWLDHEPHAWALDLGLMLRR